MSDPFLILHKVRGEPAFDVAIKMDCPACHGVGTPDVPDDWPYRVVGCDECDGTGEWWIIPTSGHRAHPWWTRQLHIVEPADVHIAITTPVPDGWPDHYSTKLAPRIDISSVFAALKPKVEVDRRDE